MNTPSRRVFISRVSREFGISTEELRNALQSVEIAARTQLSFRQEPDTHTTLEKLSKYIHESDVVLCLLGNYSGGFPPDAALDRPIVPSPMRDQAAATWRDLLPKGFTRLSYTQWEFILARYWGKTLFLYEGRNHCPDCTPHDPLVDDLPQQKQFCDYLFRSLGFDRNAFSTPDRLCRDALCNLWPITSRDEAVQIVLDRIALTQKGQNRFSMFAFSLFVLVALLLGFAGWCGYRNILAASERSALSVSANGRELGEIRVSIEKATRMEGGIVALSEESGIPLSELMEDFRRFAKTIRSDTSATQRDLILADYATDQFASMKERSIALAHDIAKSSPNAAKAAEALQFAARAALKENNPKEASELLTQAALFIDESHGEVFETLRLQRLMLALYTRDSDIDNKLSMFVELFKDSRFSETKRAAAAFILSWNIHVDKAPNESLVYTVEADSLNYFPPQRNLFTIDPISSVIILSGSQDAHNQAEWLFAEPLLGQILDKPGRGTRAFSRPTGYIDSETTSALPGAVEMAREVLEKVEDSGLFGKSVSAFFIPYMNLSKIELARGNTDNSIHYAKRAFESLYATESGSDLDRLFGATIIEHFLEISRLHPERSFPWDKPDLIASMWTRLAALNLSQREKWRTVLLTSALLRNMYDANFDQTLQLMPSGDFKPFADSPLLQDLFSVYTNLKTIDPARLRELSQRYKDTNTAFLFWAIEYSENPRTNGDSHYLFLETLAREVQTNKSFFLNPDLVGEAVLFGVDARIVAKAVHTSDLFELGSNFRESFDRAQEFIQENGGSQNYDRKGCLKVATAIAAWACRPSASSSSPESVSRYREEIKAFHTFLANVPHPTISKVHSKHLESMKNDDVKYSFDFPLLHPRQE